MASGAPDPMWRAPGRDIRLRDAVPREKSSPPLVKLPSRPSGTPRVVFALTPAEFDEFLPSPHREELHRLFPDAISLTFADLSTAWPASLEQQAPEVLVSCWQTPALPPRLPACLRYVCHLGGSTRGLLTREHLARGLLVTNWGGSVARTVAEGALTLILAALRRTGQWTLRLHRDRGWRTPRDRVESLFERSVGLHGFGLVARELVRLLRPFGNRISVFAPGTADEVLAEAGVLRASSLDGLFADHDIVVELAALTVVTRGLITGTQLDRMRPGALFVNVARGAIVDESALLRAAQSGRILLALDVFAQEPLPADSPLRGLDHVTLSPHVAGPTSDRRCDAGALAVRNLAAYVAGQPLTAVVTPEIYDNTT